MKKWIIRIVAAVAVLAIVVVVVLFFFLGDIVKKGVEVVGPQVTRVEVRLDGVKLSPFSGQGTLKGFFVGNPPGFNTPSAVKVGEMDIKLKLGSLRSDKVVIEHLRVTSPEITYEGGVKFSGSNLGKIQANVEEFTGSSKPDDKSQRKLQVNELLIQNAKLTVSVKGLGTKTVTVPDIQLRDLGTDPDGITAAELTKKITQAVLGRVASTVTSVVADLGKLGKNIGQEAVGTVKDVGEGVGKAVKGIFKK